MTSIPRTAIHSCVCLLAAALSTSASAQLTTHKDLTYAVAKAIAEETVGNCASHSYAVSVVVVDRAGQTIVALRADNASPHTMENARRKAYTAMTFRQPTTAFAKRYAENDPLVHQQVTLPGVIAIGGGLPIKVSGDVIGGAGASGSPGVDEACVQAGLNRVSDQLK